MKPYKTKRINHPEKKLQKAIIRILEERGWLVREMHASAVLNGLPDLYATHVTYGPRWIEIKLPGMKGSRWTAAQKKWFPRMHKHGSPIWVMTSTMEEEYKKLFEKANLMNYMRMK